LGDIITSSISPPTPSPTREAATKMPSQYIETLHEFQNVIASSKPVIICLGFDPNANPKTYSYGCDRLLPHFETMSNHQGFQGIDFYRVDCASSPDIIAFCGQIIPPVFVIYQNGRPLVGCPVQTLADLQGMISKYYSGPGVFPWPNPHNASRACGARVQPPSIN